MKRLPGILVVIATLVFFLAIFSVWVARQALDTDEWVDTSSSMVRDPAIQESTAAFVADQLVDQAALTGRIQELLPDRADALAAPAAGGIAELAERTTLRALRSGAFQSLWEETNRRAHEQLVELVEGDAEAAVVFDLRPMLGRVADRVGLGADAVEQLPEDRGRVTLVRSDELETVRTAGRLLRGLAIVLVVLALLLYAGAVWAAEGRRRKTLLHIGAGIFIAGLLALVLRRVLTGGIVEALTANGAAEPAAAATLEIGTSLLREIAGSVLVLGLVVMLCAWLAGPARWATRAREWMGPTLRDQPGIAYAVALTALTVIVAIGILPGSTRVIPLLLYAALVIAGVTVLRREAQGPVAR